MSSIKDLRQIAKVIYIAVDVDVALDISKKVTWAANRIEELEKEVSDMNWKLYPDRMGQ